MKNTKAQGMSTNTIILLVLGLIILVVLSIGFFYGWQQFSNFFQKSNVDDIVSQCDTSCSLNSKYDYCGAYKTLVDSEKNKIKATCAIYAGEISMKDFGINSCPLVECDKKPCNQIKINDKVGQIVSDTVVSKYDVTFLASDVSEGQKCVIN